MDGTQQMQYTLGVSRGDEGRLTEGRGFPASMGQSCPERGH